MNFRDYTRYTLIYMGVWHGTQSNDHLTAVMCDISSLS